MIFELFIGVVHVNICLKKITCQLIIGKRKCYQLNYYDN